MALDPSDVDRVAEAAKAAGVVVSEAFMYRHHAQTHRILALLDEGAVGELRLVRGCFSFPLTRDDDVRLKPEWGGGSLWDVGCYPVSYARLVMGAEPVAVSGLSERGPTGIDLTFCGALQFPGGRLATFDCGFRAAFRTFMEFVGTEASLEAPNPFKPGPHEHLRLVRDGMATTIEVQGAALYSGEVEDLGMPRSTAARLRESCRHAGQRRGARRALSVRREGLIRTTAISSRRRRRGRPRPASRTRTESPSDRTWRTRTASLPAPRRPGSDRATS